MMPLWPFGALTVLPLRIKAAGRLKQLNILRRYLIAVRDGEVGEKEIEKSLCRVDPLAE